MNFQNVITPWGKSQYGYKWMEGIIQYSTAGHGGMKVIKKLNDLIPLPLRYENGWYEEDCAVSIVHYFFYDEILKYCLANDENFCATIRKTGAKEYFDKYTKDFCLDSIKRWHTAEWAVYSGEDMLPYKLANKMNHETEEYVKTEYLTALAKIKEEMDRTPLLPLEIGKTIRFNTPVNYGREYVDKALIVPFRTKGKALRTSTGFLCRIPSKEALKRIGYSII